MTGSRLRILCSAAAFVVAVVAAGCASSAPPPPTTVVPRGWPVDPRLATISSPFGAPRPGGSHQGLDLLTPRGTPVRATADGVVASAGREGDYGRTIVVDHGNGWQSRFAHLRRIRVEEGGRVRRGDLVGTVGASGNATAPHLHYELRYEGRPVDPRPTLDR